MIKTKKFLLIISAAFLMTIGWIIYKHFVIQMPKHTTSVDLDQVRVTVTQNYRLFPGKCYSIGLWSDGDVFDGRGVLKISPDGSASYPLKGEYTLSYYNGDTLVGSKKVTGETITAISMDGKGKRSWIGLDRFEEPFTKKYESITAKLDIVNPQQKFRNTDQDIYLFLDPVRCRTEKEKVVIERREKKDLLIDNPEANATLKPLYDALKAKNTLKVRDELSTNGLSSEVTMLGDRRPVHYASFFNDAETLSYLIAQNIDLNAKDTFGKTPLHYGIENNATAAVKILLEHGADLRLVGEVDNYLKLRKVVTDERRPIIRYCALNYLYDMTELLLQHGLNPNYRGQETKWNPALDSLYLDRNINNNDAAAKRKITYPNNEKMIILLQQYGALTKSKLVGVKNNIIIKQKEH